jgi:hypothetical protein
VTIALSTSLPIVDIPFVFNDFGRSPPLGADAARAFRGPMAHLLLKEIVNTYSRRAVNLEVRPGSGWFLLVGTKIEQDISHRLERHAPNLGGRF